MDFIKIILKIIAALVVLVLIVLAIIILTFDANHYLPQITNALTNAVGRPVKVDRADLVLGFKGVTFDVSNIIVAENPQFGTKDFLVVRKAHLDVEVWPLLSRREIKVGGILFNNVTVNIVRLADGRINAAVIGPDAMVKAAENDAPVETGPSSVPTPTASGAMPTLPILSAKKITFQGVTVDYVDKNPDMPLHMHIPKLSIKISDFSLTDPFTAVMDAAVFNANENTHATAHFNISQDDMMLSMSDFMMVLDLAQVNLEELPSISPTLATAPFPWSLKGKLTVTVPDMQVGPKGLHSLKAHVEIADTEFKMKELLVPVDRVRASIDVDTHNIKFNEIYGHIGPGFVLLDGDIRDYGIGQFFSIKYKLADLKLEEIISQAGYPVIVKGIVAGNGRMNGQGFGPAVLLKNLKGDGQFTMTRGMIERLNILKTVLGAALGKVPGLVDSVDNMLNGAVKEKLGGENTAIDNADLRFSIEDSALYIDEGVVTTKAFDVNVKGTVGFNMLADLSVAVHVVPDVSAELASSVKPLEYLFDDQRRVSINGKLTGTIPKVRFDPDVNVRHVAQNALVEQGGKQLQKVIEKNPEVGNILNSILGGGQSQNVGQTTTNPDGSLQQPSSEDKTKKLLNNVLNGFLK